MKFISEFGPNETRIEMKRTQLQDYEQELFDSKFCFVIRGDTPSSHAFYDAITASCIPILVSDRWDEVAAPFPSEEMDVSSFALRITEKKFMDDVQGVGNEIRALLDDTPRMMAMFKSMQLHRPKLLWNLKNAKVSEMVLQEVQRCPA